MLEFPKWKIWLIGIVIAIGVILSIPSLIAGTPAAKSWPRWMPQYKISLGLDLAGGSQRHRWRRYATAGARRAGSG